jgi:ribosomal protein S18 acetylase RimI-like enzyme
MIVDASSAARVDLLRQATLRFLRTDPVEAFVEAPATLAFVALADSNEVIGWCWGYHLVRPDASSMLYLHELEVAEDHRRQGHGRALLDAFMAAGRKAGAAKMFLSTAEANRPARRLYDSMGGGLAAHGPTANYWFPLT